MANVTGLLHVPPGVALSLVAGVAGYLAGTRPADLGVRDRPGCRRDRRRRRVAFLTGVAVVWVALSEPLDAAADTWFSMHMFQHMLLVALAAPLLVISRPGPGVASVFGWFAARGWPRWAARRQVPDAIAAGTRIMAAPVVGYWSFAVVLWVWHVPAAYELALRDQLVHGAEHVSLLGAALLFWSAALGHGAADRVLPAVRRVGYLVAGMVQMMGLAVVVAFALPPYPQYAALGQLSAVADQRVAAAVMLVAGGAPMVVATAWNLGQWVAEPPEAPAPIAGRV